MDVFYTLRLPHGRLCINLYEVVAFEECVAKDPPHNKMVRFYMRNGAMFDIEDPDRITIDNIKDKLRGYGGNGENEYAESE